MDTNLSFHCIPQGGDGVGDDGAGVAAVQVLHCGVDDVACHDVP